MLSSRTGRAVRVFVHHDAAKRRYRSIRGLAALARYSCSRGTDLRPSPRGRVVRSPTSSPARRRSTRRHRVVARAESPVVARDGPRVPPVPVESSLGTEEPTTPNVRVRPRTNSTVSRSDARAIPDSADNSTTWSNTVVPLPVAHGRFQSPPRAATRSVRREECGRVHDRRRPPRSGRTRAGTGR